MSTRAESPKAVSPGHRPGVYTLSFQRPVRTKAFDFHCVALAFAPSGRIPCHTLTQGVCPGLTAFGLSARLSRRIPAMLGYRLFSRMVAWFIMVCHTRRGAIYHSPPLQWQLVKHHQFSWQVPRHILFICQQPGMCLQILKICVKATPHYLSSRCDYHGSS